MSTQLSSPTSLLRKYITIHFDGQDDYAYVQAVSDEHLEVLVNPDKGDEEFYAELYLEDFLDSWYIVEIHQ